MGCGICEIGSRLELFVDDALIESLNGKASLRLHSPVPRDETFVADKPWEGTKCGYVTVFQDGPLYRMYYKADGFDPGYTVDGQHAQPPIYVTYAESKDGLHWYRPDVNIYEFNGIKENNIVWWGETESLKGGHGFIAFKDMNPNCAPDAVYKATGADLNCQQGLFGMKSADGIHWTLCQDDPIMTGAAYDSQNLVFWDTLRSEYRAYVRDFNADGLRGIKTAVSQDFQKWPEFEWLVYPGSPDEQLYTNQILPYFRAPHIFVGFPSRYVERRWGPTVEAMPELEHRKIRAELSERYGAAVTDGLFMASRDGKAFKRWDEAFIRPGLRTEGSWAYGDCYQAWGILQTPSSLPGAPSELSFYAVEHYWREPSSLFRRYSLRTDGFVSVHAPLGGGELVTEAIIFDGSKLNLNISTSAGGSAKVEIQDPNGKTVPGFNLQDCYEIVGDSLDYTVRWKNGIDVSSLAGKPVKLRFVLHDADLYAYQFIN